MIRLKQLPILVILSLFFFSCKTDDEKINECVNTQFFNEYSSRNFLMGFSTWAYAKTTASVNNTYLFINNNADIYSEHIDFKIPWNAWINNTTLPSEFTDEIASRVSKKITNKKLTVSVSLLNNDRNELASDFDNTTPSYTALNDITIENAYFKHLEYITRQLNPDYLTLAIEGNELLNNAPEKWEGYKLLMTNIRSRIRIAFPTLKISESITLHNLYKPQVADPENYINEVATYANTLDFVCVSFYPYFKGLNTKAGFQEAFDFLHSKITKPIAFSESGHLSEDLSVDSYNLFIAGNQCEQNEYLETLLSNAQSHNYEYIIWWGHRDYNELWETFPDEVKDLGTLWISTGLINEDGVKKKAYSTWQRAFNK